MNTHIIILRGVNVSGKNKLPMKPFQSELLNRGLQNVQTYIQSGNIVLQSEKTTSEIQEVIEKVLRDNFEIDVPVQVWSVRAWKEIIFANPYAEMPEKQQYFTFLNSESEVKTIDVDAKEDGFELTAHCVYVNAVGGYGKTKLTNNFFEKKLKVQATTRNLKTTITLLSLAENLTK